MSMDRPMRAFVITLTLLAFALFSVPPAEACTCFFVHNSAVSLFGRNYDWGLEQGTVVVNKRGVAKTALSFDKPAEWVSKFGSVTFNQYGREFPNDGMNEAGLVVAVMWLGETQYPPADERPTVGSAQWVQYQLDTAKTVADVLASDTKVRIWSVGGGLVHYLVADATGSAAVIEWIDGKRIVHTGDKLVAAALANTNYTSSAEHLHKVIDEPARPIPHDGVRRASIARFTGAARTCLTGAGDTDMTIGDCFQRLDEVSQPGRTQWRIVYDVRNLSVHFKTRSAPAVKELKLSALDLSTNTPTKVLTMATAEPGDISSRLVDYTTDRNREEINTAFEGTFFLKAWPKSFREQVATYPERVCVPVND